MKSGRNRTTEKSEDLLDNMGPSGYEAKTFSPTFKELQTLFTQN